MNPVATTPYPLGPALRDFYPEVVASMHFYIQRKSLVEYKKQRFYEDEFAFADDTFFTFFYVEAL